MRALVIAAARPGRTATAVWAQERTPSPAGAEVYIISPKDGATVKSPVTVQFGLKGMGIAPAGVKFENTGHHHLLIDTDVPADLSVPLPDHRQDPALRQGPDRSLRRADARQAHAAARARRPEPHAAQPAGGVEEDHHHREVALLAIAAQVA